MKRNDSYILTELAGIPYLLPFGQMIADHKPGIRMNKTGVFLWKLLEQERSLEELVRLCAEFYGVTDSHGKQELSSDIASFVSDLCAHGIIEYPRDTPFGQICSKYLHIGGFNLKITGPSEAFSTHFGAYYTAPCDPIHQTLRICFGTPRIRHNGNILVRSRELIVMDTLKEFILLFPMTAQIMEAHLSKDGTSADFFCMPPYTDNFREDLFHAIRIAYLYLAQKHNKMVIHSASLLHQGKAWLFAGSSGTGKSTHTSLWNRQWGNPILNGDLNLIAIENNQAVIHGLPWCGTSGISDPGTYPLGGIILLKQALVDCVEELSPDQKTLLIMNRFISPSWTDEMLQNNLDFAQSLSTQIMICRLKCTREPSAAEVMKAYIEKGL